MSESTETLFYRLETTPATPSPHQHAERPRSAPALPPQHHRLQDSTPSSHPQHLERARSTPKLQPQGHQPRHIPLIERSKPHLWSQRLGEKTVTQFEELARNFAEQDTIEDIVNWNEYLWKQLKDKNLVGEYNAWSKEFFKPRPRGDKLVKKYSAEEHSDFKLCLQRADWNVGNESLDLVSSTMLYSRRLCDNALFALGTFQEFWLVLRLRMWAISPQKTDPQLRELHGIADGQPGGVLGLRYKPIGAEPAASILLFFPLGHVLYTEAFENVSIPDDDFAQWMDEVEWTGIPFILALGIRENGVVECRDGEPQFYFIHNPTYVSDISHNPTEDSDDDARNIIFCRNPPPYSVARVKERPKEFLTPGISFLQSATNIDLEPLSLSTPEIVETIMSEGKSERPVRFGLFPN